MCTPALSLHSFYAECTISTPCDSNPSYAAHFLHGNNSILLSASCTAIFFYHTLLVFLRKKFSSQLQPSVATTPVSSYPLENNSKDTCIHVFRITSVHSLLVLFSPTGHLMIPFTPSRFEELLALRFISVSEVTSDGKCPVAGLKQIMI